MSIKEKYSKLIKSDASLLLRPKTGLKDMIIEMDPGKPTAPAVKDGVPVSDTVLSYAQSNTSATIGGQSASVVFAGLAPGFVGLLQLNVLIPDVAAGELPFEVSVGGVKAAATVISIGAQ